MSQSPERYSTAMISIHWATLLLIAAAYAIGLSLDDMPLSPLKLKLYAWHKWLGMLVFVLVIPRLILRALDPISRAQGLHAWEASMSSAVHGLIYLLMVVAPLMGWLQSSAAGFPVVWFGVLPIPDLVHKDKVLEEMLGGVHEVAVNMLVALVAVHALAAIYHHHYRRDNVLTRMAPWLRRPS